MYTTLPLLAGLLGLTNALAIGPDVQQAVYWVCSPCHVEDRQLTATRVNLRDRPTSLTFVLLPRELILSPWHFSRSSGMAIP